MFLVTIAVEDGECFVDDNPGGVPVVVIDENAEVITFNDQLRYFALHAGFARLAKEYTHKKVSVVIDFKKHQAKCIYTLPLRL